MQREVGGRANHHRSPTEAGSPFFPHIPLSERQPVREKERDREREGGELVLEIVNCEV